MSAVSYTHLDVYKRQLPDSDGDHLLRSDADLLPEQHRLFDSSLQKEWVYFVEIFGVSALCHRG